MSNNVTAIIKNQQEIEGMREAGQLAAEVIEMITPKVVTGITTDALNTICHNYILKQHAVPAPLNYRGFPKSICTSVNHVVCHGIPSNKALRNGDIVNIDITVIKNGFHGDSSKMFLVGKVSAQATKLVEITYEALLLAIHQIKPGNHIGDIGYTIQQYAEQKGFSVVREYCGHGIGYAFHEEPQVTHHGRAGTGMELQPGMTFTIEPMINIGKADVKLMQDGWTVVTKDRSLSAQWEHTILVTETGYEVLTKRKEEDFCATNVTQKTSS